jgi:hypothetical protein
MLDLLLTSLLFKVVDQEFRYVEQKVGRIANDHDEWKQLNPIYRLWKEILEKEVEMLRTTRQATDQDNFLRKDE